MRVSLRVFSTNIKPIRMYVLLADDISYAVINIGYPVLNLLLGSLDPFLKLLVLQLISGNDVQDL